MMQAYTEEQRKALIEFTKQRIEALRFSIKQHAFDSIRKPLQSELAVAEIAMAALMAKPVGYGMQRKDNATFGSWLKPKHLVKENLIYRPAPLYLAQPVAAPAVPEWSNEQCMEFLSIAFRHAEISGDIEMDDIRLAVKMVNAAAPEEE